MDADGGALTGRFGFGFAATRCVGRRRSLVAAVSPDAGRRRVEAVGAEVAGVETAGFGADFGAAEGAGFGADRHAENSSTLAMATRP